MAKFTLHLCVEGFLAATGTNTTQNMLGRVVTVELADPGALLTAADAALLEPLLQPWNWQIGWIVAGTTKSGPLDPALAAPLEARLRDILTRCQSDLEALKLLRFRTAADGPNDDADEEDAIWPGFLAQLGRMGPQITHPLGLGYIHQIMASGPIDIAIATVTVAGTTYTVGDTSHPDIELKCDPEPVTALAPGRLGLIEPVERLVRGAGFETQAEWLSELPVRLGMALDPLARLADIRELFPDDSPFALFRCLRGTLENLFWQPAFRSIMLSIIDACSSDPGQNMDAKAADASRWASALAASRADVIEEIENAFASELADLQWSANDYRRIHASSLLDRAVLEWLKAAWLTVTSSKYDEAMTPWLETPSNAGVLLRRIFPETLATSILQPALMEEVYNDERDWEALQDAFVKVFIDILIDLTKVDVSKPKLLPLAKRLKAIVFELRKESIDIGARDGIPFRVDTVFGATSADDLHLLLDGYVVAISMRSGAAFEPYELVSSGTVTFEDGVPKKPLRGAPVQDVTTPLPVTFEENRSASPTKTETRRAIVCYRGEALIPWSDRAAAALQPVNRGKASIELIYEPSGSYPSLAYGRDYRIAVGYPAPGGILPMGFCNPANPTAFAPDSPFIEAVSSTPRYVEYEFRRTLAPSAPRLLIAEEDLSANTREVLEGRPLTTAGPMDEDVRPLWREHVARWPSADIAARDSLGEASTLYVDGCEKRSRAFSEFLFAIKAPALALGADDPNATNARLWQYWRERDADGAPAPPAPLVRSAKLHVDDPAVVGPVRGGTNRGGVELTLTEILATGPGSVVATLPITLADDETIYVRVRATPPGGPPASMAVKPIGIVGEHHVEVSVPPGTRWSFTARTMCDTAFFQGGADCRFGAFGKLVPNSNGSAYLFGTATIAIEALPELDHLPTSALLWQSIDLAEDELGHTIGRFASGGSAVAGADYIGTIRTTRQTWRWDGGPIPPYAEYKITWNTSESSAPKRSKDHLAFERAMFIDRGSSGTQETVQHVSGVIPKLFDIEHGANRGGDYLRASMMVTSRYAALRAKSDPDATYLRRTARVGPEASEVWRGRLIGPKRRDPLPTPRVGIAMPSFGSATAGSLAGGVSLFLDHPMYDPADGAGLAEILEVRVTVDRIDRLLDTYPVGPSGNGKTASLAVGLDATLHASGNPFEPYDPAPCVPPTVAFEKNGTWTAAQPGGWSGLDRDVPFFQVSSVIGQSLEISSAAARLNYAIAHIEPILGGKNILPNAVARIQVRCTAENVVSSDWSAAIWVHFMPSSAGHVMKGGAPVPIFHASIHATSSTRSVKLDANAASGTAGSAALGRLLDSVLDAPGTGSGEAYLARGIWAVLVKAVPNIRGDKALRVIDVVKGRTAADGAVHFDLASDQEPSLLRILEVQRVNDKRATPSFGLLNATERLFGSDLNAVLDGKVDAGASPDIGERIVSVGPLVPIL